MVVYAKSYPLRNPETLLKHTNELVSRMDELKFIKGTRILQVIPNKFKSNFWELLKLLCIVHDFGKFYTLFQNNIREKIGQKKLHFNEELQNIPHNFLSPSILHEFIKSVDPNIGKIIYKIVAFHHSRGEEYLKDNLKSTWQPIIDAIEIDLLPQLSEINNHFSNYSYRITSLKSGYRSKLKYEPSDNNEFSLYLLLKGLLHRLDYSASADEKIEYCPINDTYELVTSSLINKGVNEDNIWQKDEVQDLYESNVVLQANTGFGKTEFALYWLNNEKGFYTLPLRTSVNAMYERLKKTFKSENIGLLHSDSYFYILDKLGNDDLNENLYLSFSKVEAARQLSLPLSVSTADQIFTSVLKYPGYEKIYSTLAYSKIIVDEIQAYNPDMVAVILKGLKDICEIGGKFCLVTATLPSLYLDYLKNNIKELKVLPIKFGNIKKHRYSLLNSAITDDIVISRIIELNKTNPNVLIIVNTVKTSQILYNELKEYGVSLLHSGFTYKHRQEKEHGEKGILNKPEGIWITTQLAEASLDIDFSVMITEISSIDSQIQRWGRVWRNRKTNYISDKPNIYICNNPSDKGYIYSKELVELTYKSLEIHSDKLLSQEDEFHLIQMVFDNNLFPKTNYYKKFLNSMKLLEDFQLTVSSKSEAQKLFRNISSIQAIPHQVFYENEALIIDSLNIIKKNEDWISRLKALHTIKQFQLSVPLRIQKEAKIDVFSKKYDLNIVRTDYDEKIGITNETIANLL